MVVVVMRTEVARRDYRLKPTPERVRSRSLVWRCSMDAKSKCKLEVSLTYSGAASNVFDDTTEATAPLTSDVVTIPSTINCTVTTTSFELYLHSDAIAESKGKGCDGNASTSCYLDLTGAAPYVAWGYDFGQKVNATTTTYAFTAPVTPETSTAGYAGNLRFGAAYGSTQVKFPSELPQSCARYADASTEAAESDPPVGTCQSVIDASKVYSVSNGWLLKRGTSLATSLMADPMKDRQLKGGTLKLWFSEKFDGTLESDYRSAAIQVVGKQARFLFTCK